MGRNNTQWIWSSEQGLVCCSIARFWCTQVRLLVSMYSDLAAQCEIWGQKKVFPRICLPKFWAKFGWTFGGEFLLKPFVLWIKGPNCSENSWQGFGWIFAIERLFRLLLKDFFGPQEIPPPCRAIPFRRRGYRTHFPYFHRVSRQYRWDTPFEGGGESLRMLSKGEALRKGEQLAMLRHQKPHSAQ